MVKVVNSVLASGVDIILEEDFVCFALQEMEIHPLMLLIRTLSMILQTFSLTLHNPRTNHTRVNYVGTTLIMVIIVHHGCRLSMSMNRDTIIIIHKIHRVFYNNILIVKNVEYPIDQSPPQEMSIQDMEVQKQQYLEEMRSMINQIQIEDYRNKRIDIHYRRECEIKIDELKDNFNKMSIEIEKKEKELRQQEQAANESTIPLNEITSQIPLSIAITPVLPTMEPEDSLIMGNEHLNTIPEKESDKFIKSSVEDLVPIPSESEDTSDNDSEFDLPFCDNSVTFSNPLFNDNDDFTSSDAELLLEEDVLKENFKIYLNPLFEFDDEYISSDVNPIFNEILKDIESKDSYVSNLNELVLLVTPLSSANKDECFDLGGDIDEIDVIDVSTDVEDGYHDLEGDIIYLECFLTN
ncbi:hypothetical protein Tco_1014658, partial [Tanacetum coccineum]